MKTFDASRPAVAASAVGIARAAFEFTKEKLAEEGIEVDYTKSLHELTAVERDLMEMEARYQRRLAANLACRCTDGAW